MFFFGGGVRQFYIMILTIINLFNLTVSNSLESAFHESEQILEPELDPDFDWIVEAKKRKVEALEDNKIRFDR